MKECGPWSQSLTTGSRTRSRPSLRWRSTVSTSECSHIDSCLSTSSYYCWCSCLFVIPVLPAFNVTLTPRKPYFSLYESQLAVEISARSTSYTICTFYFSLRSLFPILEVKPVLFSEIIIIRGLKSMSIVWLFKVSVWRAGPGDSLCSVWNKDQPRDDKAPLSKEGHWCKSVVVFLFSCILI